MFYYSTIHYLEEIAIKAAKDIANGNLKIDRNSKSIQNKIMDYALTFEFVKDQIFKRAKAQVMKMSGGLYPAPLKILEVVRVGLDKGPTAGFEAEAKGFGQLAITPQCKGLTSLFFGQTACKRNRFGVPKNAVKYVFIL